MSSTPTTHTSPHPTSIGQLSSKREKKTPLDVATIRQLRAMLQLTTATYINRTNRKLMKDCISELLVLRGEEVDEDNALSEGEEIETGKMVSSVEEDKADLLTIPLPARNSLIDAEEKVSNITYDTGCRLLMEVYKDVREDERLHCSVSFGGEDGDKDEICFSWGTTICFIERKIAQVCHTPIEAPFEKDALYTLDDLDSLEECASYIRKRIRAHRKWLNQQEIKRKSQRNDQAASINENQ
uniref:Uncharacterized protein n=1 Tax=Percolomonas cosmopolitus TaxID=63605 RepID=A0A7S1KRH3_9EUKA|mmetsp:Transcript_6428/g.24129  ORF Transcript_6428/g.24129 Transcript_6428/m.24129 type:complete len:241 (+) Transcript_6428:93-815(+)